MKSRILTCLFCACCLLLIGCSGVGTGQDAAPGLQGAVQPLSPNEGTGGGASEPADAEGNQGFVVPRTQDLSRGIELPSQQLQVLERNPKILGGGAPGGSCNRGGPITCDFPLSPTFAVQQEVHFPLTACGGSGNFLITGRGLPQGLSVDAKQMRITGRPQVAGTSNATVRIEDIDTGGHKSCSMEIAVVYQGEVRITALRPAAEKNPSWRDLYELAIPSPGPNAKVTWEYWNTQEICGASQKPDFATLEGRRKSCKAGELPAAGTTVYVWRKVAPDPQVHLFLNGRLRSPLFAKPIDFHLAFEATTESEVEDKAADKSEEKAVPAREVSVWLVTGSKDDADTECNVIVRFCTDADMRDCVKQALIIDRKNIQDPHTRFLSSNRIAGLTSLHRYFRVQLSNDPSCDDASDWLLRGLEVQLDYGTDDRDSGRYTYYNPCILKWFAEAEYLDFGPHDAAACAVVSTPGEDAAGTDDNVRLLVALDPKSPRIRLTDTSLRSDEAPRFTGQENYGNGTYLSMALDWSDYDDFEQGDTTSYGDYIFDANPFVTPSPRMRIVKGEDGDGGGWLLGRHRLYLFEPGRFLNAFPGEKVTDHVWVYDSESEAAPQPQWLEDDTLGTGVIKLKAGKAKEITEEMASHY